MQDSVLIKQMSNARRVAYPFAHFAKGWGIARSASALPFVLAFAANINAQALGTINHPITVTVCELTNHYQRYAGRFISFRATLHPGMEINTYSDRNCTTNLPIEAPDDPWVKPKPHFRLRNDASFQKYEDTPTDPWFTINGNWPTTTYSLTVTYTGRLDVALPRALGYGHLNHSRMRLVLFSVSDVVAEVSHKATVPPAASGNIQIVPPSPPNPYSSGNPR